MSTPPFDLAQAHRWFAIECNNEAWDLVEKSARTPQETQRMISLAHAAALHWDAVGNSLNRERAENLLAAVYSAAGEAGPAVRHAERCLTLNLENAAEATPFDRAAAVGCAAQAHALAGNLTEADRLATLATAAAAELPPDDRAVIERLFRRG
ncbi:MAG: hypothetical protein MUF06_10135 [Pirellulaceae bacterium]|jgi:hypothetical protein|nr:hypothetical protein [Pirellulaceae bacterium]